MKILIDILKEIKTLSADQPLSDGHSLQALKALAFLIATNLVGLAIPLIFGHALDVLVETKKYPNLVITISTLCFIIFLVGFLRFKWIWLWDRFGYKFATLLNQKTFLKLSDLSTPFYQKNNSGACLSYFNKDIPNVAFKFLLDGCLIAVDGIIQIILLPIVLFWLAPDLAWKALIFVPLLPIAMAFIMKKLQDLSDKQQEAFSKLSESVDEVISQVGTLKNLSLEKVFLNKIKKSNDLYTNYIVQSSPYRALLTLCLELTPVLGSAVLLFFLIAGESSLTRPGQVLSFYQYLSMTTWPLMALALIVPHMQNGFSSWVRLKELFGTPNQLTEGDVQLGTFEKLEVKNLIEKENAQIFGPFNFEVKKGESLSISGPIGSGKTLLAKKMIHTLPSDKGQILYNGTPLDEISFKSLYKQVCLIGENSYVFGKSLRYNVSLNKSLSDKKVWEFLELTDLKKEFDTAGITLEAEISSGGANLSGGQRQRLILARSLAQKPNLLILDNALSSVDYETYQKILLNLMSFQKEKGMTLINISHQNDFNKLMDRHICFPSPTPEKQAAK